MRRDFKSYLKRADEIPKKVETATHVCLVFSHQIAYLIKESFKELANSSSKTDDFEQIPARPGAYTEA